MTNMSDRSERVALAKNSLRGAVDIKKKKPLLVAIVFLAILLIIIFTLVPKGQTARSESYTEATGGAGLNAVISYDCAESCDQKFDFNVYIYSDNGQLANVVRPDKDGRVNLALAEGNYVMLVGKQFGQSTIFPQEPLALKNGKTLELKLEYK
jgi:hypothetical protein